MSINNKINSYARYLLILAAILSCALSKANAQPAKEEKDTCRRLIIAPLTGLNHSKLKSAHSANITDTQPEYGLFTLYANRHLTISNMLFLTNVDSSDITGNFFFINLYGDRESPWTWNLGAGHLWHEIRSLRNNIIINAPMIKMGLVRRFDPIHLSINPYIGYSWESIDTTRGDSRNEARLYGISASWHWRMLHISCKYYLEDKVETKKYYHVGQLRSMFFLNDRMGITTRAEYMEHATIDNTSVMFGPAFTF